MSLCLTKGFARDSHGLFKGDTVPQGKKTLYHKERRHGYLQSDSYKCLQHPVIT